MREFSVKDRVFVKTNNSSKKISLTYTYSLVLIFVLTIILYLFFGYYREAIVLIKNFLVSIFSMTILTYIINLIRKKTSIYDNNILSLALIIGLFSKSNVYITIIASILVVVVRLINPKRNLSASLYGILFILIYEIYFANHIYISTDSYGLIDYIINPNFISPVLTLLSFIYIFLKKAIKYNIVLAYVLTFFFSIFLYLVVNKNNLGDILTAITISSPLFLVVYMLPDYQMTPAIMETQIIYGVIGGVISTILYILVPKFGVIMAFICLPLILTNYLEKMSAKIKYNLKLYYGILLVSFLINILFIFILSIIF